MIDVEIITGPRVSTFAVDYGAVLNITPLTPGGSFARGELVASGATSTIKQVKPGAYIFQIDLPSGEVLSEEINLEEGQEQPVRIELYSEQSPHEWLSWQQLNSDLNRFTQRPSESDHALSLFLRDKSSPTDDITLSVVEMSIGHGNTPNKERCPFHRFIEKGAIPEGVVNKWATYTPNDQDEIFALFRWGGSSNSILPPLDDMNLGRLYALVKHSTGMTELVTLPMPWSNQNGQPPIQLLAIRTHNPKGPRAKVTLEDNHLGTMLTFLSQDAVGNARPFVNAVVNDDDWEGVLYFKKSNPLAAAGAGYLLIQIEQDTKPKKWHPWIENLSEWFEWLPDGAVLRAQLLMSQRTDDSRSRDVIKWIDIAMQRGIPFYRHGLYQLHELVASFAEAESESQDTRNRMGEYREYLAPLMKAANPTEPFVSLRSLAQRSD